MDNLISVGVFDGFSWVRCVGKGSFLNSTQVKSFGDQRIAEGECVLVMDLADCSGMDSTFMGTLAGMAARLSAQEGGKLQIAEPGERNRRSLEDLGLDFLMEIDPPSAIWHGKLEEIRDGLTAPQVSGTPEQIQRVRHVLEAHQTLSDLNEHNAKVFSGVIDTLEGELEKKAKG